MYVNQPGNRLSVRPWGRHRRGGTAAERSTSRSTLSSTSTEPDALTFPPSNTCPARNAGSSLRITVISKEARSGGKKLSCHWADRSRIRCSRRWGKTGYFAYGRDVTLGLGSTLVHGRGFGNTRSPMRDIDETDAVMRARPHGSWPDPLMPCTCCRRMQCDPRRPNGSALRCIPV